MPKDISKKPVVASSDPCPLHRWREALHMQSLTPQYETAHTIWEDRTNRREMACERPFTSS